MKPLSSKVVLMAAAGVLAVGGAYASQLYMAPPKYTGPNTEQILATSQRLQVELPKPPEAETLFAETRPAVVAAAIRRAVVKPQPELARQIDDVEEDTATETPTPSRATASAPTPAATPKASTPVAAPGSNLALTGIAGSGNNREVMVFNLADRKRESGNKGDSIFGFTVAAIHDDSVDMTRGSTQVTLRLGEKSAAIEAALATTVASLGVNAAASIPNSAALSAAGTNPSGTPGGRGGDWRARMAANAIQGNLSGGGGNRASGGGGNNNNRRRSSTTQSGARRYSNGPDASRRYSTVSSGATNRNSGFRPGGFGFGGFGGRGRGGQGSQTELEATSNPQEARRTGAPLIGDVEAMLAPEAFSNPQTERRTGGTPGQAFGDSNYGNRGGNGRGGGFGGDGFGNTGRNAGGRTNGTRSGTTRG